LISELSGPGRVAFSAVVVLAFAVPAVSVVFEHPTARAIVNTSMNKHSFVVMPNVLLVPSI
jgi:hypothetical protein